MTAIHAACLAFAALLLGACAGFGPAASRPGQTEDQVLAAAGRPTARHVLAEGGTRLEYATGPYGRETWMVDLDRIGRVVASRQVLEQGHLTVVQAQSPGWTREQLLRTIGQPGERRSGGRQGGEVWSWRFATNDCLWYQALVGDDGRVRDGIFAIDPRCDGPSDARE